MFSDFGRQDFLDSYIQGGVDFIFGNAAAVFDNSEIHILRPGYLTAQSRVSAEQKTGYVFHLSASQRKIFTASFLSWAAPLRPFSRVIFLDCAMPVSLSPRGWSPWTPGSTIQHTYYAERSSEGPGANVRSRRAGSHRLTAAEAVAFTTMKFPAGVDHWDPSQKRQGFPDKPHPPHRRCECFGVMVEQFRRFAYAVVAGFRQKVKTRIPRRGIGLPFTPQMSAKSKLGDTISIACR